MIIYISIPMTGKDFETQKRIAENWQRYFESKGHEVHNPFDIAKSVEEINRYYGLPPPDYNDYLNADLAILKHCTHIFLCDGWENSNGCLCEVEYAMKHNIQYLFERTFNIE